MNHSPQKGKPLYNILLTTGVQVMAYTDFPAYSDTVYNDTPLTVTLLAFPKWLVYYLTTYCYSDNLVTVTLFPCPESVTVSWEDCTVVQRRQGPWIMTIWALIWYQQLQLHWYPCAYRDLVIPLLKKSPNLRLSKPHRWWCHFLSCQ